MAREALPAILHDSVQMAEGFFLKADIPAELAFAMNARSMRFCASLTLFRKLVHLRCPFFPELLFAIIQYIIIAFLSQAIAAEKCKMTIFVLESIRRTEEEMVCHYGLYSNVCRGQRKMTTENGLVACILQTEKLSREHHENSARIVLSIPYSAIDLNNKSLLRGTPARF